jgi:hypothetical protein
MREGRRLKGLSHTCDGIYKKSSTLFDVQIVPSETKVISVRGDARFYSMYTKGYFDTDVGKLLSQIIFQLVLLTV